MKNIQNEQVGRLLGRKLSLVRIITLFYFVDTDF